MIRVRSQPNPGRVNSLKDPAEPSSGSALETVYGGAGKLVNLSPFSRDEIQDKSALAN